VRFGTRTYPSFGEAGDLSPFDNAVVVNPSTLRIPKPSDVFGGSGQLASVTLLVERRRSAGGPIGL
jgi:hypothetical protein